ncbi:MAG: two pore domain potassium channel family protein [Rhodospirillaceae bacterium]|nr:two pore domain potassium channel family protein [Rhodospirillaceae bacterium]
MTAIIIASLILILLTVTLHFTALRMISRILHLNSPKPAIRAVISIYLVALTHFAEVLLFAIGYYVTATYMDAGSLSGEFGGDFQEYIYYSLVSYTSLGLGDVYPYGPIRLLTGVEALTGLLMIGWSASFTYLCMHKLWKDV